MIIVLIILMIYTIHELQIVRYCKILNLTDLQKLESKFLTKPVDSRHRIVVSLSTIPDRIRFIKPTIASILDQTVKVDEIALNIPYVSRKGLTYEIPTWLSDMKSVKIHRVEKDIGPSTKILPTLQREDKLFPAKQSLVIIVDDDVIYHQNTVKTLINSYYKYNGRSAVTNFGVILQADGKHPTIKSRVGGFFTKSSEVDVLQGFSGFLVTSKMFPNDVYNYDNGPKEAMSVDDVWLSGWLRLNGIKIMTTGSTFKQLPLVTVGKMRNTTALGKAENKGFIADIPVIQWFINEKMLKPVITLRTVV
jgi:hypothetical protein